MQEDKLSVEEKSAQRKLGMYARLAAIAQEKGGKIVEGQVYVASCEKMWFIDSEGRKFQKLCTAVVNRGEWSPYETKISRDSHYHMEQLAAIAANRGGRLAEGQKYAKATSKLVFVDAAGRSFLMRPCDVKSGSWSPHELKDSQLSPSQYMKKLEEIAASRGGSVLEGQKFSRDKKLKFVDAAGQAFEMLAANVRRGSWSPYELFTSEHVCRQAMECALGVKMPSRWDVVKRANGNRLQLDGYDESSKTAFEYQGYHHTENKLQMQRDVEKRLACAKAGIWLIEVQEFDIKTKTDSKIVYEHVLAAVKAAVCQTGRPEVHLAAAEGFEIDFKSIGHCVRMMEKLRCYIEENHPDGKIVEGEAYKNNATRMKFVDASGNVFSKTPSNVLAGGWSPWEAQVARDPKYFQERLEKISRDKGGRIEEGESYSGSDRKMRFVDSAGNRFEATPGSVMAGGWSPYESQNPKLEKAIVAKIAKRASEIGLTLLTDLPYRGSSEPMSFEDSKGRLVQLSPRNLRLTLNDRKVRERMAGCHGRGGNDDARRAVGMLAKKMERLAACAKMIEAKGGCLVKGQTYSNEKKKLNVIDETGKEFSISARALAKGIWSPHVSLRPKNKLALFSTLVERAASLGWHIKPGQVYSRVDDPMEFFDANGSEVSRSPRQILYLAKKGGS